MALDRYIKDDNGLRKYVELMEGMPTAKRQSMMDAAKSENALFVETAEKYIFTFDRITRLPELELTEVLGAQGLKPEIIATAIASVEDVGIREKIFNLIPRNLQQPVSQSLKDNPDPKPYDIGSARLQMIKKARDLEKQGKLESMQIPRFGRDHFLKKSA